MHREALDHTTSNLGLSPALEAFLLQVPERPLRSPSATREFVLPAAQHRQGWESSDSARAVCSFPKQVCPRPP